MRSFQIGRGRFGLFTLGRMAVVFLRPFAVSLNLSPRQWFMAFGWDSRHQVFNIHLGPFGLDYISRR